MRKNLLKMFVWRTALHECETQIMGVSENERIEAFEM